MYMYRCMAALRRNGSCATALQRWGGYCNNPEPVMSLGRGWWCFTAEARSPTPCRAVYGVTAPYYVRVHCLCPCGSCTPPQATGVRARRSRVSPRPHPAARRLRTPPMRLRRQQRQRQQQQRQSNCSSCNRRTRRCGTAWQRCTSACGTWASRSCLRSGLTPRTPSRHSSSSTSPACCRCR